MAIYEYDDPNGRKAINLAVVVAIDHRSGKNTIIVTHGGQELGLLYADSDTAHEEYARMLGLMAQPS